MASGYDCNNSVFQSPNSTAFENGLNSPSDPSMPRTPYAVQVDASPTQDNADSEYQTLVATSSNYRNDTQAKYNLTYLSPKFRKKITTTVYTPVNQYAISSSFTC